VTRGNKIKNTIIIRVSLGNKIVHDLNKRSLILVLVEAVIAGAAAGGANEGMISGT
jgi:hypothetical protein